MSYIKYRANKDAEWQELNSPVNIVLQSDTPTDNRTNLNYWYQYLNTDGKYDIREWDEEAEDYIIPEADINNWLESLDYPTGTNKATEFKYFYSIDRFNDSMMLDENISIPTIKFKGVLDMSNNNQTLHAASGNYNRHTEDVGTIILPSTGVAFSIFYNYIALKHIKVEGEFFEQVNFPRSPLTKESFTNIINALSSSATGKKAAFKKTAKEAAFTAEEWAALIATKPNWTITLS